MKNENIFIQVCDKVNANGCLMVWGHFAGMI